MVGTRFALIPLLALTASAAQARVAEEVRVGTWTVETIVDDGTGAFARCSARSDPRDGIGLALTLGGGGRWSLRLVGNLGGAPGESHPVRYRVDRGPVRTGIGTVEPDNTVRIAIDDPDAVLSEIRRGGILVADAGAEPLTFPLRDTRTLISALTACGQRGMRQAQLAPEARETPAPRTPALTEAERRLEALTLAVNILSRSKIAGFEIQPNRAEGQDVTWRAGDVTGSIRIMLDGGDTDPAVIRADLLRADMRACPGAFSAEAGPAGGSAGLSTLCRGETGRAAEYVAVPRPASGAYIVALTALPDKLDPLKAQATPLRDAAIQLTAKTP